MVDMGCLRGELGWLRKPRESDRDERKKRWWRLLTAGERRGAHRLKEAARTNIAGSVALTLTHLGCSLLTHCSLH